MFYFSVMICICAVGHVQGGINFQLTEAGVGGSQDGFLYIIDTGKAQSRDFTSGVEISTG